MQFQHILPELLIAIADKFVYLQDVNALARACRWFHDILSEHLYRLAVRKSPEPWNLSEWAMFRGLNETAIAFLDAAGDPHSAPVFYQDALCVAAREGRLGLVELLLERGTHVNKSGRPGEPRAPLAIAADRGRSSIVQILLDNGADPNPSFPRSWGLLPLRRAAYRGHAPVIKLLLDHGAKIVPDGDPPESCSPADILTDAVDRAHHMAIELIMDHIPAELLGGDHRWSRPLHRAVENRDTASVKMLLDKGYPVDIRDEGEQTALMIAATQSGSRTVELLLERGANPNSQDARGFVPLERVERFSDYPHTICLLLENGASPNLATVGHWHTAPLMQAVRDTCKQDPPDSVKAFSVLKMLLSSGADPNSIVTYQTVKGTTALQQAAWHGREDVVEELVNAGASVDTLDRKGRTALFFAVLRDHEAVVEQLLHIGAYPGHRDRHGRTLLHTAVSKGNLRVIRLLLNTGVSPNGLDGRGRTPLSLAKSMQWRGEATKLLLEYGAEIPKPKGHKQDD